MNDVSNPLFVKLGDWQIYLHPNSPQIEDLTELLKLQFPLFLNNNCNYSNSEWPCLLIAMVSDIGYNYSFPYFLPADNRPYWNAFNQDMAVAYCQFKQARLLHLAQSRANGNLFNYSWPKIEKKDMTTISSSEKQSRQFFALAFDNINEQTHLKIFGYLLFLSISWHVAHGCFLLHSAAIVSKQNGFLFLGESEAGKTTVARLSASLDYPALGDDLNFVLYDGKLDGYRLAACPSPVVSPVGYSMERPPLRMVLKLVQDKTDFLVPLKTGELARALFAAFLQETPYVNRLPDESIGLGFRIACDIARRVPGFELHFRKSTDFWKLIDEKLSD